VIVAMAAMGMVQPAVNQVIDVIAMRHGFMTAAGTMAMGVLVDFICAAHRVLCIHLNDMLFGLFAAMMHKAAVLQIIYMIPVADSHMATVRAVSMVVRVLHLSISLAAG
jgi:hypothetical protein